MELRVMFEGTEVGRMKYSSRIAYFTYNKN